MTKRRRSSEEEYSHFKRFRACYDIPCIPRRSRGHIQNYEELIEASAPIFRRKHLILDHNIRRRLINICQFERRRGPYVHVQYGSNLFYSVADALEDSAYDRLLSILHWGGFYTGRWFSERNTIILSKNLLLHIERSSFSNFDLCFIIEETCITWNLGYNECGFIDHFQA